AGAVCANAVSGLARARRPKPAWLQPSGKTPKRLEFKAGASGTGWRDAPVIGGVPGSERRDSGRSASLLEDAARTAAYACDGTLRAPVADAAVAGRGLRKHRKPSARARRNSNARGGNAPGSRSHALARGSASHDGKPAAWTFGSRAWSSDRGVGYKRAAQHA